MQFACSACGYTHLGGKVVERKCHSKRQVPQYGDCDLACRQIVNSWEEPVRHTLIAAAARQYGRVTYSMQDEIRLTALWYRTHGK